MRQVPLFVEELESGEVEDFGMRKIFDEEDLLSEMFID